MKNLVKFSTLMLVAALIFAGCKKDEPKENLAAAIEGTYTGEITMAGTSVVPVAHLTMTRTANDQVTISMNETIETSFGALPLDVSCPATVTKSDNNYKVDGKTKISLPSPLGEQDVVISGIITEEGAADLDINATLATVKFTGSRVVQVIN